MKLKGWFSITGKGKTPFPGGPSFDFEGSADTREVSGSLGKEDISFVFMYCEQMPVFQRHLELTPTIKMDLKKHWVNKIHFVEKRYSTLRVI